MPQALKCNWCHKRFTPDELKGVTLDNPTGGSPTIVVCTHAGIGMKFHPDCYELHVVRTH